MGSIHNYASNIKYDNTKTDFLSETVQDMLDEIASRNHSTTEQIADLQTALIGVSELIGGEE